MLAALLIVWLSAQRHYDGIISQEESELKLALVQRNEYREKLNGASPDQAASEIARLRDQLAGLQAASISVSTENGWPALTPNQIDSMSEILRRYPVSSLTIFFTNENSKIFRASLTEVFKRALWPMPVTNMANSSNGTGITVESRLNEGPAFALASLLRGIGYRVSHVIDDDDDTGKKIQIYVWNRPK
jgi:hypothetical protein